jgi:hypothetical protein
MPTMLERRMISLFRRSSGFVLVQLPLVFERHVPVGQGVLRRVVQERGCLDKPTAEPVGDLL